MDTTSFLGTPISTPDKGNASKEDRENDGMTTSITTSNKDVPRRNQTTKQTTTHTTIRYAPSDAAKSEGVDNFIIDALQSAKSAWLRVLHDGFGEFLTGTV